MPTQRLVLNIHNSLICNTGKMETTQMSTNQETEIQTMQTIHAVGCYTGMKKNELLRYTATKPNHKKMYAE